MDRAAGQHPLSGLAVRRAFCHDGCLVDRCQPVRLQSLPNVRPNGLPTGNCQHFSGKVTPTLTPRAGANSTDSRRHRISSDLTRCIASYDLHQCVTVIRPLDTRVAGLTGCADEGNSSPAWRNDGDCSDAAARCRVHNFLAPSLSYDGLRPADRGALWRMPRHFVIRSLRQTYSFRRAV